MQYMLTILVRVLVLCFTLLFIMLPNLLTGQELFSYQSHPEYTYLKEQYPDMPEEFYEEMILSMTPELKSEPSIVMTTHSSENYAPTAVTAVNQQDSLALVALYNSTGGDNWTRNEN
jgi:hypothetical protein